MKRFAILFSVLLLTLLASGSAIASRGIGQLRIMHASPDAPPVNVLIDGRVALSEVSYGQTTPYLPLEADGYNIKVVSADRNQLVVIDANLDVMADTDYTIAAVGPLANIEPLVLIDDKEPAEMGQARVRFVHASPDAPAVDVAVKGGDVLFPSVAFKGIGDYQTVDGGVYDLEVRVAGSDDIALELPGLMLHPGSVTTVFAIGLVNGDPSLEARIVMDIELRGYWPHPPMWHGFPPCCQPFFFRPPTHRPSYDYRPPYPRYRSQPCYGCGSHYSHYPEQDYRRYTPRYW